MKKLIVALCLIGTLFSTPVFAQTEPVSEAQLLQAIEGLKQQLIELLTAQIASLQAQIAQILAEQKATGDLVGQQSVIIQQQSQQIQSQSTAIQEIKVNTLPAVVKGCMDSKASNYDPKATESNGSCVYPALTITSCIGKFKDYIVSPTESWGNFIIEWTIVASGGNGTYQYGFNGPQSRHSASENTVNCAYIGYPDGTFFIKNESECFSSNPVKQSTIFDFNAQTWQDLAKSDTDGDGIISSLSRVWVKSGSEVKFSTCAINL